MIDLMKRTNSKNKKKDHSMIILLAIILILGLYFRLHDYGAGGGLKVDSAMLISGGVLWYVPHDYFPGKFQMYAPLAHLIVGKSCTMSGADFSAASKLQPNFLINMPALIGKPFVESEMYCLAPIYTVAILTFIGLIILGILILEKKPAIYHATFYAFLPLLLLWGRVIYVDIFVLMFVTYGTIFLWLAYKEKKYTKKETIYFMIAFSIMGLAFATKLTAGMYLIISLFMLLEKYNKDIINKIKSDMGKIDSIHNKDDIIIINRKFVSFLKISVLAIFSYITATLIPYKLNPKNLIEIYQMHTEWHAKDATLSLSTKGLSILYDALFRMNILDIFVYVFSIYILVKIVTKKQKDTNEKFIIYLCALGFITLTISSAMNTEYLDRRELPYFIGFPLLMSLAFSRNKYSVTNYLNRKGLTKKHIDTAFIIFISISIMLSIMNLSAISPYYISYSNPIMCKIDNNSSHCTHEYVPIWKPTASALESMLQDNETFYDAENPIDAYMYIRHEDGYAIWYINQLYIQQTGKDMTLEELKESFEYQGRKIRYLMLHSEPEKDNKYGDIRQMFTPIKIVYLKNHPVSYIYDLNEIYP